MHDIDDETRKEVLGEILMDELKAIREYVEDVPKMNQKVHQISATLDEVNERMAVLEAVVREHDAELRKLKHKTA
ncbi:hypothetical protein IRY61_01185 [Candidatus Saccharibacteria bacterium]|jgi:hypothetical protein|nr:hypothetical protein [Candidatus Saccharibacteria bacterium]